MKTYLIILLILISTLVHAQDFTLSVLQPTVIVNMGDSVSTKVRISAKSGFTAPVFISIQQNMFGGKVRISKEQIDFPYLDSVVIVFTPTWTDTGLKKIDVIAQNGTMKSIATVTIQTVVPGSLQRIVPLPSGNTSFFLSNNFNKRILVSPLGISRFSPSGLLDTIPNQIEGTVSTIYKNSVVKIQALSNNIFQFDGQFWQTFPKPSIQVGRITNLISNNHDELYAVTDSFQVFKYRDSVWKSLDANFQGMAAYTLDSNMGIWYIKRTLLYRFDGVKLDSFPLPSDLLQSSNFMVMTCNKYGHLWVTVSKTEWFYKGVRDVKVYEFNGLNIWRRYNLPGEFGFNLPHRINYTEDSTLWITMRLTVAAPAPPELSLIEIRNDTIMSHRRGLSPGFLPDFYTLDCMMLPNREIWFTEFVVRHSLALYNPPEFKGERFTIDTVMKNGIVSVLDSDNNDDRPISIVPNPALNSIYVDGIISSDIDISSSIGVVLLTAKNNVSAIDISHLPSGTYYIRCTTLRGVTVKPFVIVR
ncbi:MAG: T9SS type A sorting domain-containing protein [Candidatus Kapabacteria bacterium]|nr:T9SS type A sorting domain-containing protein [Candidatus Kapabacteria bacterium]